MPAVPEVFGYDPRLQFVHEDDVTRALAHTIICERRGTFNVAGPGTITWGEASARVAAAGWQCRRSSPARRGCRCGCCA